MSEFIVMMAVFFVSYLIVCDVQKGLECKELGGIYAEEKCLDKNAVIEMDKTK